MGADIVTPQLTSQCLDPHAAMPSSQGSCQSSVPPASVHLDVTLTDKSSGTMDYEDQDAAVASVGHYVAGSSNDEELTTIGDAKLSFGSQQPQWPQQQQSQPQQQQSQPPQPQQFQQPQPQHRQRLPSATLPTVPVLPIKRANEGASERASSRRRSTPSPRRTQGQQQSR